MSTTVDETATWPFIRKHGHVVPQAPRGFRCCRSRLPGFGDIREVHRPLLRYPPIDGMRPTDLAAHLKLSKQATNDLLRDLENLGYLRLERDPTDGRARIFRYTERGWHLFRTGSRLSYNVGQRWAQAIGQRRYDQFHATLRTIVDLTHGR